MIKIETEFIDQHPQGKHYRLTVSEDKSYHVSGMFEICQNIEHAAYILMSMAHRILGDLKERKQNEAARSVESK